MKTFHPEELLNNCIMSNMNTSKTAMERVSSIHQDYGDSDSDSDEDEDPRNLVDRLIEKGTQLYMEGENSGLSSDSDDDDDDYSDFDSDSDITDVSPIISASVSPLMGLSPILSRRRKVVSPLALFDNKDINEIFRARTILSSNADCSSSVNSEPYNIEAHSSHPIEDKSTNMDLLLQAVLELENQNNIKNGQPKPGGPGTKTNLGNTYGILSSSAPIATPAALSPHPVRDNPHHRHLRKLNGRRKNMSFSNEEVRKIDRENKILLKKLLAAHSRPTLLHLGANQGRGGKHSHSSTNRRRDEDRIIRENMILLKKIQEAKPSKDITSGTDNFFASSFASAGGAPGGSRGPSGGSHHSSRSHSAAQASSSSGIKRPVRPASTGGSCGAALLSSPGLLPHVVNPLSSQARKETAL